MSDKLYTLEEAKQLLKDEWKKGVECPCCTQFVKLYPLKIPAVAVADLIKLYNLVERNHGVFDHVSRFSNLASRSFAKLHYWKLIEQQPNDDAEKRTSGMWALTRLGVEFVEGDAKVPEKSYIFNMKCYGTSPNEVGIQQALGNKFNYEELMREYE